eukprot:CAMPEP_0180660204 /NCGR_PEP_ID=MMETSP1037_2-20121125/58092_1 /TAXON_ID=632150 /ORGANISM="Azadinium spinosum, Strain 3D9" /LENGTH=55 /DNA_ID=CAMNT_0022687501 /DNA_START=74 /DNA_END=238 /DNA_ORIENTATION=-
MPNSPANPTSSGAVWPSQKRQSPSTAGDTASLPAKSCRAARVSVAAGGRSVATTS